MSLAAARLGLVGVIAAAGYRAVDDPRDVDPPCVLVAPVANITRVTNCAFRAAVAVYVLAPPPGNAEALDWSLAATERLLDLLQADGAEPARYQVGGQELPGYVLTVQITT